MADLNEHSGELTAEQEELLLKAQQLMEEKDSESRVRTYIGKWAIILSVLAVVWSIFQLYATSFGIFDAITLRSWHIIFIFLMAFIMYPAFKKQGKKRTRPTIPDLILMILGAGSFLYLVINYKTIALRGGWLEDIDYWVATIGILVVFEAGRRVTGNLLWLALVFFLYNFLGPWIPGAFGHGGFGWERVVEHMFWGSQGLLGVGVGVSATYIFLFILFGSFLKHSGFSNFINDVAMALVGRTAGGPAKVAVCASALMGMINGSALANVATTGAITIPLMKKTGYRPEFAGAVEAVASTGGQFAPPIMGAVGFLMAEFLGVPYLTVMLAAIIPAFLFYMGLLIAVHLEARKIGLKGLAKENIPNALVVLKNQGHLLLPLIVLMGMLFMGYTPLFAAVFSILATIIASWLRKETRMNLKKIYLALEEGAKGAVGVAVACVIIGVIIGTVSLTGLGLTFGHQVLNFVGEGQLFIGGFFVMLMSVVLGMGVPGVAAYVIVAAVAVPVLIDVGAVPLAAHMFCLFYACLSNITPPVAMSSYVAAGIANSDQNKTSLIAVRLGLVGFILPFFFLDNTLLLYSPSHDFAETLLAFVSATLGVCYLVFGLQGWMLSRLNWLLRLMLLAAALLSIHYGLLTDIIGLGLFLIVFLWQKFSLQKVSQNS